MDDATYVTFKIEDLKEIIRQELNVNLGGLMEEIKGLAVKVNALTTAVSEIRNTLKEKPRVEDKKSYAAMVRSVDTRVASNNKIHERIIVKPVDSNTNNQKINEETMKLRTQLILIN